MGGWWSDVGLWMRFRSALTGCTPSRFALFLVGAVAFHLEHEASYNVRCVTKIWQCLIDLCKSEFERTGTCLWSYNSGPQKPPSLRVFLHRWDIECGHTKISKAMNRLPNQSSQYRLPSIRATIFRARTTWNKFLMITIICRTTPSWGLWVLRPLFVQWLRCSDSV